MGRYSYVTVILLGDVSLPAVRKSLKSVEQLNYPHDLLECLLLLPPQKPQPRLSDYRLLIRTIQFDLSLDWDARAAVWEGLDFARGEFIQILSGRYSIYPEWLSVAGGEMKSRKLFGISGRLDGEEESREKEWLNGGGGVPGMGLFDRGFLRYVRLRENWMASSEPPGPPLPDRLAVTDVPMACAVNAHVQSGEEGLESGGILGSVIRRIIRAHL